MTFTTQHESKKKGMRIRAILMKVERMPSSTPNPISPHITRTFPISYSKVYFTVVEVGKRQVTLYVQFSKLTIKEGYQQVEVKNQVLMRQPCHQLRNRKQTSLPDQ